MKSRYFFLLLFLFPVFLQAQWNTIDDYSLASKVSASAASNNDVLFIAGGNTQGFQANNHFDIFYYEENRWERIFLSSARVVTSSTISGNLGFVSGGTNWSNYAVSNIVDIIDLTTLELSAAALQQARAYHASIAYDGKVYIAGGATALNSLGPITVTGSVEIYDVSNESWTTMELSEPRSQLAVAELSGKLYFAGGWNDAGEPSDVIDIYDVANDSWMKEKLSIPRIGPAVGSLNGKIYFAGGSNEADIHYDIIDIYDEATNEWSTSNLSTKRTGIEVVTACDKIYFVGGGTADLSTGWITDGFNTVDVYDDITKEWSTNNLIAQKYGAAVASIRDRIYVAGGWDPQTFFNGSGTIYLHECERSPTSTTNITNENIIIAPNPAALKSEIQIFATKNIEQVKIYNAFGQLMQHSKINTNSILLNATINPGIYFCLFESNGGLVYVEKLVVE